MDGGGRPRALIPGGKVGGHPLAWWTGGSGRRGKGGRGARASVPGG